MPIHDWTRVDAGLFHAFHQTWIVEISAALNRGMLPRDYFALPEQVVGGPIPDVATLERFPARRHGGPKGSVAVAEEPPQASYVTSAEADVYAEKADRVAIKHRLGDLVAVIEIVSPGNKSSRHALRAFVKKNCRLLRRGINLLIVDLFPPTRRDPKGIHKAIWDQFQEEPFELPSEKPLIVAAYSSGMLKKAYVNFLAVGDPLPSNPIFLDSVAWVPAPLEVTYQAAWDKCPDVLQEAVEGR